MIHPQIMTNLMSNDLFHKELSCYDSTKSFELKFNLTFAEVISLKKHSLIPTLYPFQVSAKHTVPTQAMPTVPLAPPLYVRNTNKSGLWFKVGIRLSLRKLKLIGLILISGIKSSFGENAYSRSFPLASTVPS
jgi:hypothetical protein